MTNNDDKGLNTKLVVSFFQVQRMQQLESYFKRGRMLENKIAEELKERWVYLFRELAELNNTHETERNDIEAELSYREDDPPYDLVETEIESFIKNFDAGYEEWKRDPNRNEDDESGFLADWRSFLDDIDKPSN